MKLLITVTIVCVVVFILMWCSFNQTCLISKDGTYKGLITIHNKYVKIKNNKVLKGKELFYIQPYQNIHFILSSNGQMLGLDIDKKYVIVQNAVTQNPIIIKNGKLYALDLTTKKLLNISDQIEVHSIIPIFCNEIVENHLRQYIYDLLNNSNFSEIPF